MRHRSGLARSWSAFTPNIFLRFILDKLVIHNVRHLLLIRQVHVTFTMVTFIVLSVVDVRVVIFFKYFPKRSVHRTFCVGREDGERSIIKYMIIRLNRFGYNCTARSFKPGTFNGQVGTELFVSTT